MQLAWKYEVRNTEFYCSSSRSLEISRWPSDELALDEIDRVDV